MTASPVTDDLIAFAHRLADAARPVVRRYFRTPFAVDTKSNETPVTIADREAEAAMRALIQAERPQDGILGEEHGTEGLDRDFVWVLDPIDGTKSFMTGRPIFGTLIGLTYKGRPVLGIIDQPIAEERWVGAQGRPTTFNGASVRTRPCADIGAAVLTTTSPDLFPGAEQDAFRRVDAAAKYTIYGSDCYGYGLLASGFLDLVVETGLGTWDWVALVPVVEGAGGRMTGWQGEELLLGADGRVVASGDPALHARALELIRG